MVQPYYSAPGVDLYYGDMREVIPALGLTADVVVTDPPYGETSLAWDRWPDGWPQVVASCTRQLWCFGSMRMFLTRRDEFDGWKLAQDVVWEKNYGSSLAADRFRRVHEHSLHWYQGSWADVYRDPQREASNRPDAGTVRAPRKDPYIQGGRGASVWVDDGTRLVRSVIHARTMWKRGLHPTEKPAEILRPLIAYSCPPGGLVVDPFAGSGSTLVVARETGRRAIGVEANEAYCEIIARRLSEAPLTLDIA